MKAAAIGIVLLGVLSLLPGLVGARPGVSPRVAAGAHLVALVGWGLLPALWLACLGGSVGSWLAGIRVAGGGCLLGLQRGQWQLVGYLPAAGAVGVLVWQAIRLAVSARRAELRGLALAGSARREVAGGAVAAAYGRFPPVRRAWDGLRRELEAAADDEAVRAVGSASVISALVRVALLAGGPSTSGTVAFGDAEHLRYRIARLQEGRPVRAGPTALVGSSAVVVASVMAWSACLLAGADATTVGVVACGSAIAAVGLRPTWAWGIRLARR